MINVIHSRSGSVGVDMQLIFINETVLPNATSIQDDLKTGIVQTNVSLPVIPSSIIVGEFLILSGCF